MESGREGDICGSNAFNKEVARMGSTDGSSEVELMTQEKSYSMQLGHSKSGKGARMFSPSGKKVLFCNMASLKDFCNGLIPDVIFTVAEYTGSEQSTFADRGEDEDV